MSKILKVIAWILMVPVWGIIYFITLLDCEILANIHPILEYFSLIVMAVFVLGVALRNKIKGGITVSMVYATILNLIISFGIYSFNFS